MESMNETSIWNASRNDIVIAKDPFNPIELICKRVKALPGDKIEDDIFDNNNNSIECKLISKIVRGSIKKNLNLL